MNIQQAKDLTGRILAVDGLPYTVTSASTYDKITVFDPRKNEYIFFDSLATFENWAYGKSVSSN